MTTSQSILFLDDQLLLAIEVAEYVEQQGYTVLGPFSSAEQALAQIAVEPPDVAILDINLGNDQTSEPVAAELTAKGVPYAFLTGYGSGDMLPDKYDHIERVAKPAHPGKVQALVTRLLETQSS